jgi:pSer/pThr/pTyr-binding forkhead associated (FHA) protein
MAFETTENHLLIIEDDESRREFTLDLERPMYSIGRHKNCDIRLYSPFVGRHHATLIRFTQEDNSHSYYYRIVDGDSKGNPSSNGLMINGRKILAHNLKDGDEIVFGGQARVIYFRLQQDRMSDRPFDVTDQYDITLINPGIFDD